MNTADILEHAFDDGVTMSLTPTGTIKMRGDGAAVNRWLPMIREHKPDILAALQEFEALLARVGPAYLTPGHEYDEIRLAAMRDLDSALQSLRLMAKELDAAKGDILTLIPEGCALPEERHKCTECANLTQRGRCMASQRGEIDHVSFFEPVQDVLRRCAGFKQKRTSAKRLTLWGIGNANNH